MTLITEDFLRKIGFTNRDAYTLRLELPCAVEDWTRFIETTDIDDLPHCGWEIASYNESEALEERALVWDQIDNEEQLLVILTVLGKDMTQWQPQKKS